LTGESAHGSAHLRRGFQHGAKGDRGGRRGAIGAARHQRNAVIGESVDLPYNPICAELGITPAEVWPKMDRRDEVLGMAEELIRG
jgi:hypothetical protein